MSKIKETTTDTLANNQNPEMVALHVKYRADPTTNAVAVPIYQTTSYQFQSTEHAAQLFGFAELGNIYHADHEPDKRYVGTADQRYQGWRWRAGSIFKIDGLGLFRAEFGACRRQYCQLYDLNVGT